MSQDAVSDAKLWKSLREGNSVAYSELYKKYAKMLIGYCYRLTNDTELIKDAIHELFLEIWKNRNTIKEIDYVKFYLFHSIRNKLRNKLKKAGNQTIIDTELGIRELIEEPYETLLIDTQKEEELHQKLRIALKNLTPRQAEAINLRYYHNFSNEEIAQIMGIGYQTVTNTLYQALKELKKELLIMIVAVFLLFFY
jgi:RNA polymerase sigma factor (sigma-70 family)